MNNTTTSTIWIHITKSNSSWKQTATRCREVEDVVNTSIQLHRTQPTPIASTKANCSHHITWPTDHDETSTYNILNTEAQPHLDPAMCPHAAQWTRYADRLPHKHRPPKCRRYEPSNKLKPVALHLRGHPTRSPASAMQHIRAITGTCACPPPPCCCSPCGHHLHDATSSPANKSRSSTVSRRQPDTWMLGPPTPAHWMDCLDSVPRTTRTSMQITIHHAHRNVNSTPRCRRRGDERSPLPTWRCGRVSAPPGRPPGAVGHRPTGGSRRTKTVVVTVMVAS